MILGGVLFSDQVLFVLGGMLACKGFVSFWVVGLLIKFWVGGLLIKFFWIKAWFIRNGSYALGLGGLIWVWLAAMDHGSAGWEGKVKRLQNRYPGISRWYQIFSMVSNIRNSFRF